jgi:hypothetical protein
MHDTSGPSLRWFDGWQILASSCLVAGPSPGDLDTARSSETGGEARYRNSPNEVTSGPALLAFGHKGFAETLAVTLFGEPL